MDTTYDNLFSFLSLRPIRRRPDAAPTQNVIRDQVYSGATVTNSGDQIGGALADVDLYSRTGPSRVGQSVFSSVRRGAGLMSTVRDVERVLLQRLPTVDGPSLEPILTSLRLSASDASRLAALAARPQVSNNGRILVFPGGVDDIRVTLAPSLSALRAEMQALALRFVRDPADSEPRLEPAVAAPAVNLHPLVTRVFSLQAGGYTAAFEAAKRVLFDALYGLLVLRKAYPADPAPAISGLQTLHAMERMAVTLFALHTAQVRQNATAMPALELLAKTLRNAWPRLAFGTDSLEATHDRLLADNMPFVMDPSGPQRLFDAQPVVPPIMIRLGAAFEPFNDLRPVGVGDLMVVRQRFLGYRKGEIARIETVLAGESKDRTIRRLDRSEDTQSFAFSEDSETTSESTTSERYELKREAEAVMKMDVAANLSASVTYNGTPVVSNVTASASLSIGKSESEKLAQGFARDVTERALSRVQRRASQARSRTLIAETEDTSVHRLAAPAGPHHVNGFYRWVDKVYEAEVRNYGRRLMFELVVPEPAAFHVQSKLLAHIASLGLPDYPAKPATHDSHTGGAAAGVSAASEISPAKWEELNRTYFLDHLPPPAPTVEGVEIVRGAGARTFSKSSDYWAGGVLSDTFRGCRVQDAPPGYVPRAIRLSGEAKFAGKDEPQPNWQNEFVVEAAGVVAFSKVDEKLVNWDFGGVAQSLPNGLWLPPLFDVVIKTKTAERFNVTMTLDYAITQAALDAWKAAVFAALVPARLRPTGPAGAPIPDPAVEAYLRELSEVERPSVRRLLQGGSSAANKRRVEQEIKRLSISQFTREFDVQAGDDQISGFETMGEMPVGKYRYPAMSIKPGDEVNRTTRVGFDSPDRVVPGYAVPDVGLSRRKGPHVQFIEHAFEWSALSYVFYPYYWATPPKWVELLDREDDADPFFTDFLQAGAARVLVAVRPGFEDAVMHYLATREPWNGGAVPVIGDDLHLPVHEEIRELTEDRASAGVPVGEPWTVTVPTSLVFLESSLHPLPDPFPPPSTPA